MEPLLLLLLLGLAALAVGYFHLALRMARLEKRIGEARFGPAADAGAEPGSGEGKGAGQPPPPPGRETLASLFEQLVGGRLLIWIGSDSRRIHGERRYGLAFMPER